MDKIFFDERRQSDPQGVIDDLVRQTTAQARSIHDLTAKLEKLAAENDQLRKESPSDHPLLDGDKKRKPRKGKEKSQ